MLASMLTNKIFLTLAAQNEVTKNKRKTEKMLQFNNKKIPINITLNLHEKQT